MFLVPKTCDMKFDSSMLAPYKLAKSVIPSNHNDLYNPVGTAIFLKHPSLVLFDFRS